jgi:hypothetical protein
MLEARPASLLRDQGGQRTPTAVHRMPADVRRISDGLRDRCTFQAVSVHAMDHVHFMPAARQPLANLLHQDAVAAEVVRRVKCRDVAESHEPEPYNEPSTNSR